MLASLLIVDDYVEVLETLQELFSLDGRLVRTASSAATAIETVKRDPVAVVLIDEDMPDMTGTHLAFHLRAVMEVHHPAHPFAIISVRGDYHPDESTPMPAGFDHFLHKPVDFSKFLELVAQYDAPNG